jgi:hypothetical protein
MAHVVHWQSICTCLYVNLSHANKKVIYSTLVHGQTSVCHFPALYPYLLHSISRCCPGMTCSVLAYHLRRSPVTFAQRRMTWDRKPKDILHPVWVWSVLYRADRVDCWDYCAVAPVVKQSIKREHNIQLQNTKSWYLDWNIKDAFEIELHPNNLKREDGLVLSR